MYLQDTVNIGSGTAVDIYVYSSTSHSFVRNYILYILNILYLSVLYYDILNGYNTLENSPILSTYLLALTAECTDRY